MAKKDGFDSKKRWGNSAMKGHGVNSPAMMEDRKKHEMAKKMSKKFHHPGTKYLPVHSIHKGEKKEE